jgi:hypothetical protein
MPTWIPILSVNPEYDKMEAERGYDWLDANRAAGDVIETNADGSITCTPNPSISQTERFEILRKYQLEEQRRREARAKIT